DPAAVPRTRPMYRRLVEVFERTISRGQLAPGVRRPPQREPPPAFSVSPATIVSARRGLAAKGPARGHARRGTLVAPTPHPGGAPFAWRGRVWAAALQSSDSPVRDLVSAAADPKLISFAAGEPALERFPTDEFQRALDRILASGASAVWRHGPTEGQPRFRAAV